MGDPAGRQRRLRRRHGRRAGYLPEAARSRSSPRLCGRKLQAVDRRDARSDSGQTRTSRQARLRIRAKRRGQYIHDFRAAGGLAPRQGHRPPRRRRLRAGAQGTVRRAFSRRRPNQAGPRQSEHAHARLALRGLSRPRSAPPRQTVRMALHPQTRKLARHGRIRTRRPVEPMSEPPHSRQADPRKRSRRLGGPPQQASCRGQLAIHHRRRPREAQEALPLILNDSGDYRDRIENRVPANEGRGVFWEGGLIYDYLYDYKENARFVPLLLDDATDDGIPRPLKNHARYRVNAFDLSDPGFEGLYRELTG